MIQVQVQWVELLIYKSYAMNCVMVDVERKGRPEIFGTVLMMMMMMMVMSFEGWLMKDEDCSIWI